MKSILLLSLLVIILLIAQYITNLGFCNEVGNVSVCRDENGIITSIKGIK